MSATQLRRLDSRKIRWTRQEQISSKQKQIFTTIIVVRGGRFKATNLIQIKICMHKKDKRAES